EQVLAGVGEADRRDAELLAHLAHGALERRLALLEATTRPVDLAGAEAALLADEQHLLAAHDEDQRRRIHRLPGAPVDVGEASRPAHVPRGRPRTRWATMLRCTSLVPPAIVAERS